MLLSPMEYKIKIIHRPGLTHSNVDPLSRHPSRSTFIMSMSSLTSDLIQKMISSYATDDGFEGLMPGKLLAEQLKEITAQSVAVAEQLGRVETADAGEDGEISTTQSVAVPGQLGRVEVVESTDGAVTAEKDSFEWSEEGILLRTEGGVRRICVPQNCRIEAIQALHDEMGHPRFKRTLEKAKERLYWPKMGRDIEIYCRSCHECQVMKTDTARKPGSLQPIPAMAPFHTICIDFVEGLPPTNGFDSLATYTDKYTKAVRLIPCEKADTAEQFARRYFESIFSTWGTPSVIISDRDRQFTSGFWKTLMSLAGTKLAMTTAYHPQADGQLECTNRTIEATLRIMLLESGERWVKLLLAVEFAHNSCINTSTKKSPFDLLYGEAPENFGSKATRSNFRHSLAAEEISANLTKRREEAESAMKRAQQHQKRYYDGKHSPIEFLPGDLACLRLRGRNKLEPTATVVQVIEVISPVSYRIKVPQGSKMHDMVSVEHLRRYVSRDGAPPTLPTEGQKEERIKRVLGERMWNNKQEILCVREGEAEAEAAWEDVETLGRDLSLLKEFRERSRIWMRDSENCTDIEKKNKRKEKAGDALIDGITAAKEEDIVTGEGPRRSDRKRRIPKKLME